MSMLQLRIGGKYKTRDGQVVTITSYSPDFRHYNRWGGDNHLTYTDNGQWLEKELDPSDLISEVLPEPAPTPTTPDYIYPSALVQLRDGSKARVYVTDAGSNYPIHGSRFNADGRWFITQWAVSGQLYQLSQSGLDIVGPWQEPTQQCPTCGAHASGVEPVVEVVRWGLYDAKGEFHGSFESKPAYVRNSDRFLVKLTGTYTPGGTI